MDTKEFLRRVSAPVDEIVICVHKPDPSGLNPRGIFWSRGSFADLVDAVQAIEQWDRDPDLTVYYSVGRFAGHRYTNPSGATRYHRYANLATYFKTLALDLDIGANKPYATQRDGWVAMQTALATIGLPTPMVVSSGNGIHCYWPLTEEISTAHWEKASIALRMALADAGVQIDTSKIHDPSMVLRPVGTNHKKQTPWKPVALVADCPDFDPVSLFGILKPWFGKVAAAARGQHHKPSGAIAALLGSGDISLSVVVAKCKQLGALVSSGGVLDAAGNAVSYDMWRASLGFAKFCNDPQAAVISLAGLHKDFDLTSNMEKLDGWGGTGPTNCSTFEQHCPTGCSGCPYQGNITNPAQLTADVNVTAPPGVAQVKLPGDYYVHGGRVWLDEEQETTVIAADGKKVKQKGMSRVLVCPYEMHITGVFTDLQYSTSPATLAVKYPLGNWQSHDLPLSMLATSGRDLADYLINKQVFILGLQTLDRTRSYLMRYLEMVQKMSPTGTDFSSFGYQPDGSFLCGEQLLGAPTGNAARRLKGAASRYGEIIRPHGDRAEWVRAMSMLDAPGAENVAASVLMGGVGLFGKALGNSSFLFSVFSSQTTTGKSLCLRAAISLFGRPSALLLGKDDTINAIYKVRGTLNHLPGTIDELTLLPPEEAVGLAYSLSSGREKLSLTREREVRDPVTWDGPTLVSCNCSLYEKYDEVMSRNDPVRARTLEVGQHDQVFINSQGREFFDLIEQNFGFAIPEIMSEVYDMGGPEVVARAGAKAYDAAFGFQFLEQERWYRTGLIGSWIFYKIGHRLGLFPFDGTRVFQHLQDRVVSLRTESVASQQDAFDIIGQFLQENNDLLIVSREEYVQGGKSREVVQYPLPVKAVSRINIVYDAQNPILPGSKISINQAVMRRWLGKSKDNLPRLLDELRSVGALISERERVTIYKGCQNENPGQALCIVLNANHPRFAAAFTGTRSHAPSAVTLAVLQGGKP